MNKYGQLLIQHNTGESSIVDVLKLLPSCNERQFEKLIVELISKNDAIEYEVKKELENDEIEHEVAYKAFFLLCTIYRRRKDISLYGEMFKKWGYNFENEDTYGFLKAMYLVQTGVANNIKQAAEQCMKSLRKIQDNVGIKHCFCEIIAEGFEEKVFNFDNDTDKKRFEEAYNIIYDVMYNNEQDYAKFYCTYGRILALNGDFQEAKIQLRRAIDKEDSSKRDYSLRIGEYTKHLMMISSNQQTKEIDDNIKKCSAEINKFSEKIDDSLIKNLEFLGFFAGLVSFIIASVQIIAAQNLNDGIKLILVLGGVLMMVISSFSIILNGKRGQIRSIIVFLMGLITIVLGVKFI